MRPALFLVLPLVLAACATPRESCLSSVGQQGRVIDALISQTRGNVARGYAIEEREELRTRRELCEFRRDDGSIGRRFCNRTTAEDVRVPVTIDRLFGLVKLGTTQSAIRPEPVASTCLSQGIWPVATACPR